MTIPTKVINRSADSWKRHPRPRRWVELIVLFGIGPALLALGPRWMVTAGILGIGLVAAGALLMDPSFARGDLVGLSGARRRARTVVLRTVLLVTILVVGAAVFSPRPLPPQARPVVWAIDVVLYPSSAYAQEDRLSHLVLSPLRAAVPAAGGARPGQRGSSLRRPTNGGARPSWSASSTPSTATSPSRRAGRAVLLPRTLGDVERALRSQGARRWASALGW
jgi:hypothetical protein